VRDLAGGPRVRRTGTGRASRSEAAQASAWLDHRALGLVIRGGRIAAVWSDTERVEPLLTPESAVTPAAGRLAEANRAAFAGLPGVIGWDLEKRA